MLNCGEIKDTLLHTIHVSLCCKFCLSGHHPAAAAHYTYQTFSKQVTLFFDKIVRTRKPTTELFWVESVAPPLHQDKKVREYKDWRTYHRILLFAHIAMERMVKLNVTIKIVPAFQSKRWA